MVPNFPAQQPILYHMQRGKWDFAWSCRLGEKEETELGTRRGGEFSLSLTRTECGFENYNFLGNWKVTGAPRRKERILKFCTAVHLVDCYLEVLGGDTTAGTRQHQGSEAGLKQVTIESAPILLPGHSLFRPCGAGISSHNMHFSPSLPSVRSCW